MSCAFRSSFTLSIPVFVCLPRVRIPSACPYRAAAGRFLSSILVTCPNHVSLFCDPVNHYLPVSQLLQCHLISDLVFPTSAHCPVLFVAMSFWYDRGQWRTFIRAHHRQNGWRRDDARAVAMIILIIRNSDKCISSNSITERLLQKYSTNINGLWCHKMPLNCWNQILPGNRAAAVHSHDASPKPGWKRRATLIIFVMTQPRYAETI